MPRPKGEPTKVCGLRIKKNRYKKISSALQQLSKALNECKSFEFTVGYENNDFINNKVKILFDIQNEA